MTSGAARRRLAHVEQALHAIAPPEPDPEQQRREDERFFDGWALDIAKAAHEARGRRARGEPLPPSERLTGLEVCGEAVSYNGFQPPESVRVALRWLTREEPGGFGDDAMREVLRRAFNLFAEQTMGPGAGE